AFLIAVITFLFPFIFMIAEFASLKKSSKSGLTSWIHTAVGRKTAFITAFMFWFANLTYFFSAVPSRINFLSFAVTGQDFTTDSIYKIVLPFVAVAFFAIITLVSTLNTKKLSKIVSLGGGLMLALTAFFFIMATIGWITGAINPDLLPGTEAPGVGDPNIWGDTGGINFAWMSTFIWVLMAADGGQSLGVYVKDVRGGKKAFTKSMIISVMVIGGCYIIGTLLASVFPPTGGLAAGWANSFVNLFTFMFSPMGLDPIAIQKFSYILIGSIFFISSIGGLIIWTSAPVKVMFSEIAPGIFGSKLSKQNKNGVCSYGAWLQFLIVAPFLVLLMWPMGDSVSENLSLIKGAAGWIGMLPWIVIFVSYVNLRFKKDHEERSFRMGNRTFGITVGIILSIITIIILVVTFLDTAPLEKPISEWPSNWWIGPLMKVVMISLIVVPAYLWYYFKYEYQLRDTKISSKNNFSTKYALIRYSFTNKFVLWLKPSIYEEYIANKNKILIDGRNASISMLNTIEEQLDIKSSISIKLEQAIEDGNYIKIRNENLAIDREASKKIRVLKKAINKNAWNIRKDVIKLTKNYKLKIKEYGLTLRQETKSFYSNTMKPLLENYKNKSKGHDNKLKSLMQEEFKIIQEKDINFDDFDNEKYGDYKSFEAHTYYSRLQKVRLDDKIIMNENEIIIIRNFADSLVGERLGIKNVNIIKESIDKNVKSISSGIWDELELVSITHVENNQFENLKIYVKDADDFVSEFNKYKLSF
ncbi:MAG: amino acid permease, partial [Mycoplasmataceae bacterium]|nr:amino acid permease [Mycoplasmataceae bacterium]